MDKLTIGTARLKCVFYLIGSLGFVIAGLFILTMHRPGAEQAAWPAIMFFGAAIPVFVWQLLDTRPRLVIDDNGVYDRRLKIGVIPFADIEDAYVMSIGKPGQEFICLRLRDETKYLRTLSPIVKALCSVNRAMGATAITLNLSSVDADASQLCDLIKKKSMLAK